MPVIPWFNFRRRKGNAELKQIKPKHDKTCAPSEDSDQPWASAQSDQSSLCSLRVAMDTMLLHADSEDSEQTGWMPRLIRLFAERTGHFVCFVML